MFCSNCGAEILQGARFCVKCGTPIAEEAPMVEEKKEEIPAAEEKKEETPAVEEKKEETPAVEEKKEETPAVEEKKEVPLLDLEEEPFVVAGSKPSKGAGTQINPLTKIIVAFICLVIVAAVAFIVVQFIIPMFGGKKPSISLFNGRDKQMVYMEDEDIYYLKDMTKPEKAIKIDRTRDMGILNGASFSEDGKYLYFYNRYDEGEYTLNRVKLSKLKKDGSNDKYIEEIASDVTSYSVSDAGVLYYMNEDSDLIEYKKGKERELESKVVAYKFSKNQSKVYCRLKDGEQEELCVVNLSSGESQKLDDEIDGFSNFYADEDMIVYYKNTKDSKIDVYTVKGTEAPVCVVEDASFVLGVDEETGTIYYEEYNMEEKTLYDFVNDTAAKEDEGIKEPTVRDGLKEVKEKKALNACLSSYEDKKYRTGKAKDLQEYYDQLYYDDEADLYYDYSNDYDKTYYYDDSAKKWYVYNEKTYQEKYKAFEKIADRIYLREDLKEMEYTISSSTVYSIVPGQDAKEICAGAKNAVLNSVNDMLIYSKAGEGFAKKDIKEIKSVSDLYDYVDEQYSQGTKTYYRIGAGEEQIFDIEGYVSVANGEEEGKLILSQYVPDKAKEKESDEDDEEVNYDESYVLNQGEYTLYYCEIAEGKVSKPESITDEAYASSAVWVDDALYYLAEADYDEGVIVNLYKYQNGESQKILEEVSTAITVTEDGHYVDSYDDLILYNSKGEDEKIAKDVTDYSYLKNNRIVYVADKDLYVYDGKEEIRITKDVQGFVVYIEQIGKDVYETRISYDYAY